MRALAVWLAVGCGSGDPSARRWGAELLPMGGSETVEPQAGVGQVSALERLHIGRSEDGTVRVAWREQGSWTVVALGEDGSSGPPARLRSAERLPVIDGAGAAVGTMEVAGQARLLGLSGPDPEALHLRLTRSGGTTVVAPDQTLDARDPTLPWTSAPLPGPVVDLALDSRDHPWVLASARDTPGRPVSLLRWGTRGWSPVLVVQAHSIDPAVQLRLVPVGTGVVAAVCENNVQKLISAGGATLLPPPPACGEVLSTDAGPAHLSRMGTQLQLHHLEGGRWSPTGPPLDRARTPRALRAVQDPAGGLLVVWAERLGHGRDDSYLQPGLPQGLYAARLHEGEWTTWGGTPSTDRPGPGLGPAGRVSLAMDQTGGVVVGGIAPGAWGERLQLWSEDGGLGSIGVPTRARVVLARTPDEVQIVHGTPSALSVQTLSDAGQRLQLRPPDRPLGTRISAGPRALFTSLSPAGPTLAADWGSDSSLDRLGGRRLFAGAGRVLALDGERMVLEQPDRRLVLWTGGEPVPLPTAARALSRDPAGAPVILAADAPLLHRWSGTDWEALPAPPDRAEVEDTALAATSDGLALLRSSPTGALWLDRWTARGWVAAEAPVTRCGGPCGPLQLTSGGGRLCAAWSVMRADGPHPVLWCQQPV